MEMETEEGYKFHSTPAMVEGFKTNWVWQDILMVLALRRQVLTQELVVTSPDASSEIARIQASIMELEGVVTLPDDIIEEMIRIAEYEGEEEKEDG